MKIRHPVMIQALGFVIAWLVRLWISTVRFHYRPLGPDLDPHRRQFSGRYVYAFWHENMMLPAYFYARPDIWVLISQHADGQLIAEVCRHLGFRTVRGSTTRGGVEAVRQMLRLARKAHLAITPDGPRGPRRQVQPGLVYLAARTGMAIVPVGIGFHRPWRLRSWDRFALPRPWSFGACVTDEPIVVPSTASRATLAEYSERVEAALRRVTAAAEEWAQTGRWSGWALSTQMRVSA
jgi:lysophospholipid acyltransferase (LPLAT)-like uncharacterized protein